MFNEKASTIPQFTHSLKLEESAKDVRISVHVYTNGRYSAINEAIATFLETKQKCKYHNSTLGNKNHKD